MNVPKIDRKKLFIPIGVVIVLGAAFYLVQQFRPTFFMSAEQERVWRDRQEEQVTQIIRAGDIAKCDEVDYKSADGIDYRTVCRNNVAFAKAQETLDPSWCTRLDEQLFSVAGCEQAVAMEIVTRATAVTDCKAFPEGESRAQCEALFWMKEAQAKRNVSLCAKASGDALQAFCRDRFWLARLAENPLGVRCEDFSEYLRSDCEIFKSISATGNRDPFSCNGIVNPYFQDLCRSAF